jgi:hypothetical protein
MVIVPVALLDGSATLLAVSVTLGAVRICGAVYMPPESIVPTIAFPPGIPFTLQFTVVFAVLLTVAVKLSGSPSGTDATDGATATVMLEELEGGGCSGPDPASPLQPRNDAMKSSAEHQ